MNVSSTLALLQALAALLTALHGAPQASPAVITSAVGAASRSIQLVAQTEAQVPFQVQLNDSVWPNINDLVRAAYRDASGNWVHLGPSVTLIQDDTSFGDLNGDGMDDAAVVVNKPDAAGSHYYLAAMLNQGGVMFDAAELPLGNNATIASHHIASGTIMLDNNRYQLFGTTFSAF